MNRSRNMAEAAQRSMHWWGGRDGAPQMLVQASGAKWCSLQKGQVVDPACLVVFVTGQHGML
jgi:hypothetical protein